MNPALVEESGAALKLDSQNMKLDEIVGAIEEHVRAGELVVRLHSGDPSLYGAIVEQMAELERRGIEAEIVPGVSSLFAASAALRTQFTLRDVSESLVITRPAGATLERDLIPEFSRLGQTMVVFLGTERMEEVLARVECPPETPAAVVYHASWPDEKVVRGRWPISPEGPRCRDRADGADNHRQGGGPGNIRVQEVGPLLMTGTVVVALDRFLPSARRIAETLGADLVAYTSGVFAIFRPIRPDRRPDVCRDSRRGWRRSWSRSGATLRWWL